MLNLFQVLALHSLKPMPVYVVDLTDTPVDGTIVSNFIRKFMGNAQFVVISRRWICDDDKAVEFCFYTFLKHEFSLVHKLKQVSIRSSLVWIFN